MDTIKAIKERRSIRKFKNIAVDHELISQVVEAAIYAPSWKNTQITRYHVVEDAEIKTQIAKDCVPGFNQKIIDHAPMLLVLSVVKNRSGFERDGSYSTSKGGGWQMFDCGIASSTLCLAAHSYGLGTVIMGIFDDEKIAQILHIPQEQEVTALIAIGYADEEPDMPRRKSLEEVMTLI